MTPTIPTWIQIFVLAGVGVVILLVPLRVFFEITKGARDRMRRLHDLSDRLKERFGAVQVERWVFGLSRIHFTHEGRPAHVTLPGQEELVLRLEPQVRPKFPVIIETRGRIDWRFAVMWDALRILPRVRTHDPLIDDTLAIYASGSFGGYLRELALDGIPSEGKPTGLAESLVVLRRLPGIRRMVFRMSPAGGFRVSFELRAEDLLYRPDELEAAVYHAFRIHDLLVLR